MEMETLLRQPNGQQQSTNQEEIQILPIQNNRKYDRQKKTRNKIMSYTQQLRITLWKDYLLRKRKPGVIFLSCFCAVAFFSILLGVRLSLPPEAMPTCQFRPRAMPSVGLIPFAQSFICSIGNECLDEKQYEEYPALEDSQMAAIVSEMQPLLQDETFIRISKSLPKGVDLITVMADILSYPDIQKLLVL
ncbi:phospholipid-transporting ATPase ABCA1-like [Chrysoperla carnea]|uniref:phospholipid-transporting ATPase ABCA1-like n=1 Tax=Chrysoperla carnea TaxID=189513 RepID=UPI001D079A47|nr:phospholipid-transporting ATPase ABCA1-like [Chrysoperla carnea]